VKVTNICYYKFLTSTPGSPSRRPLPGRPLRRDPQEDQAVQRLVGQVWPVALSLPAVRPWRAATRICQVMRYDLLFRNFSDLPWQHGLVILSLPATEETRAMGREIQTRQGFGVEAFRRNFLKIIYYCIVSFLSGTTYQQ
jgi:hypothetical protein